MRARARRAGVVAVYDHGLAAARRGRAATVLRRARARRSGRAGRETGCRAGGARPHALRHLGQRALVHLEPGRVPTREATDATPETRIRAGGVVREAEARAEDRAAIAGRGRLPVRRRDECRAGREPPARPPRRSGRASRAVFLAASSRRHGRLGARPTAGQRELDPEHRASCRNGRGQVPHRRNGRGQVPTAATAGVRSLPPGSGPERCTANVQT